MRYEIDARGSEEGEVRADLSGGFGLFWEFERSGAREFVEYRSGVGRGVEG